MRERKFAIPFIASLAITFYNLLYGSKILGASLAILIAIFTGINIYATEIRRAK